MKFKISTVNKVVTGVFGLLCALVAAFATNGLSKVEAINTNEITINTGDDKQTITKDDYLNLLDKNENLVVEIANYEALLNSKEDDIQKLKEENSELSNRIVELEDNIADLQMKLENKQTQEESKTQLTTSGQDESDIQKEKVSLLDKEPILQSRYCKKVSNVTDMLNNVFPSAFKFSSTSNTDKYLNRAQEYRVNKEYSKLSGTLAFSSENSSEKKPFLVVYADETLIYTSPFIEYKTDPFYFEVDISNANYIELLVGDEEYRNSSRSELIISDLYIE